MKDIRRFHALLLHRERRHSLSWVSLYDHTYLYVCISRMAGSFDELVHYAAISRSENTI